MNVYEQISLNDLSMSVWKDKYKHKEEKSPEDTINRIRGVFAKKIKENLSQLSEESFYDKYQNLSQFGKKVWEEIRNQGPEWVLNYLGFDGITPGGSAIFGIGNLESNSSISNCFVIESPHDSLEGINYRINEMCSLEKARGGVGINLSSIRPKGSNVKNQSKRSTGVETFVIDFSQNNNIVAQDGRRGALMICLDVEHPDVMDFIRLKSDHTKVTGANLSVLVTDKFMEEVERDDVHLMKFPLDSEFNPFDGENYDVIENGKLHYDEETKTYWKVEKARDIWNEIVHHAWKDAEPGVLFKDNWYKYGTDGCYSQYRPIATNPCSEIAMGAYDSCRLMSMNLLSCVNNRFSDKTEIDYNKVYFMSYIQLLLCDTMIDIEIDHINNILNKLDSDTTTPPYVNHSIIRMYEKLLKNTTDGRRCGAGFLAYADMLAAANLKYTNMKDYGETFDKIEKVFRIKRDAELDASIDMAVLYGAFKGFDFDKDIQQIFFKNSSYNEGTLERMKKFGRRNVSWSTAAPTGTISLMCQTTSGIEPLFLPYYKRRVKIDGTSSDNFDFVDVDGNKFREFISIHPGLIEWYAVKYMVSDYKAAYEKMSGMDIEEIEAIYQLSPYYKQTAADIDIENRILTQSLVQKYTTHSISSTLNLPSDCTEETISDIYMQSWKLGLKGNTVYREGCRNGVIVSVNDKSSKPDKRPETLRAVLHKLPYKKGFYGIIIGFIENKPYEIFIVNRISAMLKNTAFDKFNGTIQKIGDQYDFYEDDCDGETQYEIDQNSEPMVIFDLNTMEDKEQKFMSLVISRLMRQGETIDKICEILDKSEPISGTFISRLLKILSQYKETEDLSICPNCGTKLTHENGCVKCMNCGWSKC